jgi:heat-inducible transcriptional repressor
MMEERVEEVTQMKELLLEKEDKMERLLKKVAKVLAINTEYATMITSPSSCGNKLKFIQLSRVDDYQLVAVIVIEGNIIKNNIIEVEEQLDDETILKLNILLNTNLNGMAIEEINLAMITKLKNQAGMHSEIVGNVMDAVGESIKEEDLEIYTSGTNNILKYPELNDKGRASGIINTFEEKNLLTTLLATPMGEEYKKSGIKVYIGEETPIGTMKDCSVVTATYELGEGMQGTIGIVGPKRMDYEKVVETLKTVQNQLDSLYKKKDDRKEDKKT